MTGAMDLLPGKRLIFDGASLRRFESRINQRFLKEALTWTPPVLQVQF